jgi:DNA-directed RNA polymerase subunit RPC12/RpoP
MSYQDKSIRCADCGQEFAFTASEQQFFAEKGFTNEPKRCPTCRRARRDRGSASQSVSRSW